MANLHLLTSIALFVIATACTAEHGVRGSVGGRLSLPVTGTVSDVDSALAPGLRLSIRRDLMDGRGTTGWDVAVYAAADTSRENLLYHSREWHGPYPSQIDAWSLGSIFPAERELSVRDHPWIVLLHCDGCTTIGDGDTARFVAGTLRVEWRPASDQ